MFILAFFGGYFLNFNPFDFRAARSLGIVLGPMPCSSKISASLNFDSLDACHLISQPGSEQAGLTENSFHFLHNL
jgi:hypothetical protein